MPSERDEGIDAAIAAYLAACDAGSPPERADFLARYPDLAGSLGEFLDDHARMKGASPPSPDAAATLPPAPTQPPDAGDTATLPPSGTKSLPVPHDRVRYFGDYELLAEVARGGMGVVFRARQVSLNREVVLKMILSAHLASEADKQRFRLEAEAAANLDHPNVLPIYEVGEHDGQQYFSMKLVNGGSLADRLAATPRPPVRELVALLAKVCRAVHFAHQRGVLHRDLKPGNVLIDADGTPFVTDFGLAKKVGREDSGLTRTGAVVGTPSYMAPEQARAEKGISTAADVYSLGAILYEVITGRPPFRGPTVMDTLLQVMSDEPPDPRTIEPKADRDLALVALKCLAKSPADRYESASELADDLDRWLTGEPLSVRPLSPAAQAWRWLKRNAGAVAGSTVVGGLAGHLVGCIDAISYASALSSDLLPRDFALLKELPAFVLLLAWAIVFVLVAGLGRITVRFTRPKDPATAVATGLFTGLWAGVAAFALEGPFIVLLSQQDTWAQGMLIDNRLSRAFFGIWLGLVVTVVPYPLIGAFSCWAAEHMWRVRGPGWKTTLAYGELMLAGLAISLIFQSLGKVAVSILFASVPLSHGVIGLFNMVTLSGLAVLVARGVLTRWCWWWRLTAYLGWLGAMSLGLSVLVDYLG